MSLLSSIHQCALAVIRHAPPPLRRSTSSPRIRHAPLLLVLLVAACGDLPEPFLGNPGATARRLATPVTAMLAVPAPTKALLPTRSGADFAELLADGLQKGEVAALARAPARNDWSLAVTADRRGEQVVPRYVLLDQSGREQGAIDGSPLAAPDWAAGAPWVLGEAARDAVPKVLALMTSIRATRDRADPNSLLNRVAKLYVPEVTGAPGDGNQSLSRLIRAGLAEYGPLIQYTPDGADFTVKGDVLVAPSGKDQQRVEITWTVTRPSGALSGKVSQLNSIPAGTLNGYWGDVAAAVAREASGGVYRVVERFIGHDPSQPAAK